MYEFLWILCLPLCITFMALQIPYIEVHLVGSCVQIQDIKIDTGKNAEYIRQYMNRYGIDTFFLDTSQEIDIQPKIDF